MKSHTCFLFFGGLIFTMASNFSFTDRIPFWVTQKPIYSISACPENNISILHLIPLYLRFCRVSSNFSKLSYQSSLLINNRPLMYAQIKSNPHNISFLFSWKMSGELLTPIGKHLHQYFRHGGIILHILMYS